LTSEKSDRKKLVLKKLEHMDGSKGTDDVLSI
jgi:flagellar assembly factor FliW